MEVIQKMNAKEILNELRTYDVYKNETDYYIKKAIGHKKQATVDELKGELIKLKQSKLTIEPINTNTQIKVGDEFYNELELLEMIQFYNQHHKKSINYFENQDILHNIMLHSQLGDTNAMLRTSKLATRDNENQFWKNKLKHDYPLIQPKSNNYKDEYKNVYQQYLRAKKFVKVLKAIKKDSEKGKDKANFSKLYINDNNDLNTFDFLPAQIKNELINTNDPVIEFQVNKEKKKDIYHFIINLQGTKNTGKSKHQLITSVELNEHDYVMFFTALLYENSNISIEDGDDVSYLYNPNEPDMYNYRQMGDVWKYWGIKLNKK